MYLITHIHPHKHTQLHTCECACVERERRRNREDSRAEKEQVHQWQREPYLGQSPCVGWPGFQQLSHFLWIRIHVAKETGPLAGRFWIRTVASSILTPAAVVLWHTVKQDFAVSIPSSPLILWLPLHYDFMQSSSSSLLVLWHNAFSLSIMTLCNHRHHHFLFWHNAL